MCSETGGIGRFYDGQVNDDQPRATGRCLCGAVTYEVRGPLRDITLCHCVECRRWSGHVGAFAAAQNEHLLVAGDALRWIDSPASNRHAQRAFCGDCGSSLFWKAAGAERTGIAAGTLDPPTGLHLGAHIHTHQAPDWDALPDDGLPRDPDASFTPRWS
jgi:hypothetical protein